MSCPDRSRPRLTRAGGRTGASSWDCRHLSEKLIDEKLSQIRDLARDFASVDMTTEPVPIRPGMHYQMGGVKTDIDGMTNVPGLYAAGEAACVSVHGGNRLGANSLLDTLVFGRRSGEHAAGMSRSMTHKPIDESAAEAERAQIQAMLDRDGGGESFGRIRFDMGTTMNDKLAVFRDREGIREAMATLAELKDRYSPGRRNGQGQDLQHEPHLHPPSSASCSTAPETIALGALEREESRGAHFRTDMQGRDDENWLRHILLSQGQEGPGVEYLSVVITQWQPQARTY